MLTAEQIENNKQRFMDLISGIGIEGANIAALANWLESKSDFFYAPASTRYHCSYEGGLCQHSLNVYDELEKLAAACTEDKVIEYPEERDADGNVIVEEHKETLKVPMYSEDTIRVVSLLHDISKANFYERYLRNVKNEVTGQWEKVPEFRVRDEAARFIYGSHEATSEYMARTFVPLSVEESVAIMHHHAGMSFDSTKEDVAQVFNRYPLATMLHMADMTATFLVERKR